MSRIFMAQFTFRGACCGQWHDEGTDARYNLYDEIVAVDCNGGRAQEVTPNELIDHRESLDNFGEVPTEAEQEYARKNRCDSCFLVHAGECF